MKSYLLTLLGASLAVTLVGLLSPKGEGGGMEKHLRLICALFLIFVLISPLSDAINDIRALIDGKYEITEIGESAPDGYREQMQQAADAASRQYFSDMLTQTLEQKFSIAMGDVRCSVIWDTVNGALQPTQVTVLLSGKAIWKSPRDIESFVSDLVGCICTVAIESK